jgi:hypothetical protein
MKLLTVVVVERMTPEHTELELDFDKQLNKAHRQHYITI